METFIMFFYLSIQPFLLGAGLITIVFLIWGKSKAKEQA